MSFDAGFMFASLLVSGAGFVVYSFGRSNRRFPHMVAGAVMVIYPYFVPGVAVMLLVAAGVLALTWLAGRLGY